VVKLTGARVLLAFAHFYGQNNVSIARTWPHVAQGSARRVVLSIAACLFYVTTQDSQSYTVWVIWSLKDTSRTRRLGLPDQLSVSPENANHTDKKFPIYITRWSINTFPKQTLRSYYSLPTLSATHDPFSQKSCFYVYIWTIDSPL